MSAASTRIDAIMEQASQALVHRRYFEAERLSLQALRKAHAAHDYERIARIVLPLQEARRQKRDIAIDAAREARRSQGSPNAAAGGVFVIADELPTAKQLLPGCYLVCPPRVGVDGRTLRETADRKEIPIVVTVREPTTQSGQWPIVSVGPVTVRAKVAPPPGEKGTVKKPAPPKAKKPPDKASKAPRPASDIILANATPAAPPPPEWFVIANEALGDQAILSISETASPQARVDALIERLEAVPDHEKLHQALAEAARDAARAQASAPARKSHTASARTAPPDPDEEHDGSGEA